MTAITINGTRIAVGQVWEDRDSRMAGRRVTVLNIETRLGWQQPFVCYTAGRRLRSYAPRFVKAFQLVEDVAP